MQKQFNIFVGICIIHIFNLTLVTSTIISNNESQSTVKKDEQKNNEADFSTELKECIKLLSSNVVTLEVFKDVSKKLTNDIMKPLKDIKNLQLVNKHEVYNFADQIGNRNPEYIRDVSLYYFLDLDDPYIQLDNARDFLVHINCKIVRNLDNTITAWAYSHHKFKNAPAILKGNCSKCTENEIKQTKRVLSHIEKNYPKEYARLLKQYDGLAEASETIRGL